MTDAEDTPAPPPRQIETLRFYGIDRTHGAELEVVAAVTFGFDPYVGDTLHVSFPSPLGLEYRRYLTLRGDWADRKRDVAVGDEGFPMPAGFASALQEAFRREADTFRAERDDARAQLATLSDLVAQQLADRQRVIDAAVKATEASTGAIVALSERLAKQEAEIAELRVELEERSKR